MPTLFFYRSMVNKDSVILQLNKKIQRFNYINEITKALKNNREDVINVLKDQMRSGKDAEGLMDIYRDLDYAEEKRSLASYFAPYPHRDLFFTGKFQRGIYMEATRSKFKFWSRDSKTAEIVNNEGEQIFDLNPEGLEMVKSIVNEDVVKEFQKIFANAVL